MNYSVDYIKKGLEYYGVTDDDFIAKTVEAAEFIKANGLEARLDEYTDKCYLNYPEDQFDGSLWGTPPQDEMVGMETGNRYIVSVMMLCAWELHKNRMAENGYDEYQTNISKLRFTETLMHDVTLRKLPMPRMSRFVWGLEFVNMHIVETGSLQFEKRNEFINLHIPQGVKFDRQTLLQTLRDGQALIKKYYGVENMRYECHSWLLSKELTPFLREGSNILDFQRMFDITSGPNCNDALVGFLYLMPGCTDYGKLLEGTSLQRSIKKYLLEGGEFLYGFGVLKKEFLG